MTERKWKCCSCDAISLETELLRATNPFDKDETIEGCPICKYVCGFTEICDEPECTRDATCGFPVANGYRRTCYRHIVRQEERGLTQHALDAATVAPKCTTEKLCPVHNVWHAAPPRK